MNNNAIAAQYLSGYGKVAILDLELGVVYGYYIPDVVDEVRRKVAARLKETTGLVAKEINVRVVSIKLPNKKKEK